MDEPGTKRLLVTWPTLVCVLLAAASWAWMFVLCVRYLNVVQVDHAGHIASAAVFAAGHTHGFDDSTFLGVMHGVFYPPLDDVLLSALRKLSGGWLTAYAVYLVTTWAAFMAALVAVARRVPHPVVRILFVAAVLWTLSTARAGFVYQGLSMWDTVVLGLGGEVLGATFLLMAVHELLVPEPRVWVLTVWATFSVFTHLVVGLAMAVVLGAAWLVGRERRAVVAGLWTLGLTTAFWLPLVAARERLVHTFIVPEPLPILATIVAAVVVVLAWREARARALAAAGFVLYAAIVVAGLLHAHQRAVPAFHYHRLASVALLLVLGAAALGAGSAWPGCLGRMARAAALAVLVLLPIRELPGVMRMADTGNAFVPSEVDASRLGWKDDAPYARQWTIEDDRASASGLDALVGLVTPGYRAVKGLYWEAMREHTVIASYVATIYGPPVVLDYVYGKDRSCPAEACMIESFARTANLGRIAFDEALAAPGMLSETRTCLRDFARTGKIGPLGLRRSGELVDGPRHYTVFDLVADATASDLRVVEPIDALQLVAVKNDDPEAYKLMFSDTVTACDHGRRPSARVFAEARSVERLLAAGVERAGPRDGVGATSLRPAGDDRFAIEVTAAVPSLIWIKLSWFPGVRLLDDGGHELPLEPALPGMLALGHGKMTLVYAAPPAAGFSLAVSLATLLAALGFGLWARRRRAGAPTS